MTPERFRQIEELYHAARDGNAEDRVALLSQADPDLRQAYNAPAPVERRLAGPDMRQAYNAPPPQSRRVREEQQEYLSQGWVYGPYGWVPPRPPRRWSGRTFRSNSRSTRPICCRRRCRAGPRSGSTDRW